MQRTIRIVTPSIHRPSALRPLSMMRDPDGKRTAIQLDNDAQSGNVGYVGVAKSATGKQDAISAYQSLLETLNRSPLLPPDFKYRTALAHTIKERLTALRDGERRVEEETGCYFEEMVQQAQEERHLLLAIEADKSWETPPTD